MAHVLRPEDLDFVGRAPIRNEASIVIDAPPSAIWPAISEAPLWAEWFEGVSEARWVSEAPHGVGSVRHLCVEGLDVDEQVIVHEPESRFAFTVTSASRGGFAAMVEVVSLDAADGRTEVVYRQAIELAGLARLFTPLVRRRFAKGLEVGLAGLKRWSAARTV